MRFLCLWAAAVCGGVHAAETIAPPEALAPVRELVAQSVAEGMAPSVAVAVIQSGTLIWLEAFGEADHAVKAAATVNTPYPLASCTKPLTALALLQLRARGLCDLDKPANAYLGEGALRTASGNPEEITARRALNHTAGFARYFSYYYPPVPPAAPAEVFTRYGLTAIAPGTAFEYSNLGYTVAGAIVAKCADAPWSTYIQDNVFAPLALANSSAEGPPAGAAALYVRDAAERFRAVPPVATDHPAGSAAWCSIADAARLLQVFLGEGSVDGVAVASPEAVRETLTAPKAFPQAGLGWFLGDYLGKPSFSHAGSLPGCTAEMRGFPAENTGIVVLTNGDGNSLTGQIIWTAANALFPGAVEPEPEPRDAPETDFEAFQGDWTATLGHFSGPIAMTLLVEDEDTAYLRFEDGPMRRLQGFGLQGDELSGHLWAELPARDDFHLPVKCVIALRRSGESLEGTFATAADALFHLPLPITFTPAPLGGSNGAGPAA